MDDVKHLSIFIARSPEDVFDYAANPKNLPAWAAGLAQSQVELAGDAWVASAPFGKVKIRFALCRRCGVLDHDVELESGVVVHNPMRVVPRSGGSEFIFTLFRQPGMSDEEFQRDAAAVRSDLATLKSVLESSSQS